jgi:hypothetical protein
MFAHQKNVRDTRLPGVALVGEYRQVNGKSWERSRDLESRLQKICDKAFDALFNDLAAARIN